RNALGAPDDRVEQLLAALVRALLRVVEEGERPDTVVPKAAVVEQDAGDDERARERAAPCLVRAGDEPRTELAVEPEELLAGALVHAFDLSARCGRRQEVWRTCRRVVTRRELRRPEL